MSRATGWPGALQGTWRFPVPRATQRGCYLCLRVRGQAPSPLLCHTGQGPGQGIASHSKLTLRVRGRSSLEKTTPSSVQGRESPGTRRPGGWGLRCLACPWMRPKPQRPPLPQPLPSFGLELPAADPVPASVEAALWWASLEGHGRGIQVGSHSTDFARRRPWRLQCPPPACGQARPSCGLVLKRRAPPLPRGACSCRAHPCPRVQHVVDAQ